jgi:hypothetical protein
MKRVYGGLVLKKGRQVRCVVAGTQREVADVVGTSLSQIRGWWAVTGNAREVALANAQPGTLVYPDEHELESADD